MSAGYSFKRTARGSDRDDQYCPAPLSDDPNRKGLRFTLCGRWL